MYGAVEIRASERTLAAAGDRSHVSRAAIKIKAIVSKLRGIRFYGGELYEFENDLIPRIFPLSGFMRFQLFPGDRR